MKSSEELREEYDIYFDSINWKGFQPEQLGVVAPYSAEKFFHDYHEALKKFEAMFFDNLMRIEWADRKVSYKGIARASFEGNYAPHYWNYAIKTLYQSLVGYGRKMIKNKTYRAIQGYANDFFPGFEDINGFEFFFKFPFEHITLEYVVCVADLKERLELLKEAEEKKLTLPQFHDYVAQYCTDERIRTGRRFKIYWNRFDTAAPYVNEVYTLAQKIQYRKDRKQGGSK